MQLHDKGCRQHAAAYKGAVRSCMADSNPSRKAAARHLSESVISQYHREHGTVSDTRDNTRDSSRIKF